MPERRTGNGPAAEAAVSAFARAKINLYLHVLGRRADGYHDLDSLVVFAGTGDRIEAAPAGDLSLTVTGPFAAAVPVGEDNLVLRAARALAAATGVAAGAAIRLDKHLPAASGMGGGSADAAATIRTLSRLWRVELSKQAAMGLALGLGADVPICLAGRPAYLGGIGEAIEPAPMLPPAWLILANPLQAASTPRVFAARQGAYSQAGRFADAPADAGDLARLLAGRRNDLTAAATSLVPAVGSVIAALQRLPGALIARMSGSGATAFALFAEAEAARQAARRLAAEQPNWWVAAAPLLREAADTQDGEKGGGAWTSIISGAT